MQDSDEAEMGLLVSFPDQSETFTLGFEVGQLWEEMAGGADIDRGFELGIPIHTQNMDVVARLAAARDYQCEFATPRDGWIGVKLTRQVKVRPALSIVSVENNDAG